MGNKNAIRFFALLVIMSIVFGAISAQMTVTDEGENMQPPSSAGEGAGVDPSAGTDPSAIDPIPQGPSFTPDASFPMPRPQKPRFDRFNRWMKVLNEFFTKGDWLNGGPSDLLQ